MEVYEVLRRPIITEKTSALATQGCYTFEVDGRASKMQIKEAVEKAFGVRVVSVNVCNMPGKPRRWGRHVSRSPVWKKAMVTLAEGQRLEFFEGV